MNKYQDTVNNYRHEKVDRIELLVPKGEREEIRAYAKTQEKKLNAYIVDLIHKDMARNSSE